MRYASIRQLDISNGEGIGIALFVQGCHFKCYNCFNPDTWDFNGGKEWDEYSKEKLLELINKPYIKRISILGGEPLADENIDEVLDLINKIKLIFPSKTIWLYTGYTWEQIMNPVTTSDFNTTIITSKRKEIVSNCDVIIDGRYIDSQRDITLKWRGSSNQRVIDVNKSLYNNEIILYNN